jgi:hypothetical protein
LEKRIEPTDRFDGENRLNLASLLDNHVDRPFDREARGSRDLIECVAQALYDRHEQFPQWPRRVQHFYACYDLNFQGFAKIAYNAPHLLPIAQEAFERFGRLKAAALCERAVAMLPEELAKQIAKGFTGGEDLEAVLAHIDESALVELDRDTPSEFWADDALHYLVQRNREDFASVDRHG